MYNRLELISKVKDCISKNDIPVALNILVQGIDGRSQACNDLLLINRSYESLTAHIRTGLITREDHEVKMSELSLRILTFSQKLKDTDIKINEDLGAESRFSRKINIEDALDWLKGKLLQTKSIVIMRSNGINITEVHTIDAVDFNLNGSFEFVFSKKELQVIDTKANEFFSGYLKFEINELTFSHEEIKRVSGNFKDISTIEETQIEPEKIQDITWHKYVIFCVSYNNQPLFSEKIIKTREQPVEIKTIEDIYKTKKIKEIVDKKNDVISICCLDESIGKRMNSALHFITDFFGRKKEIF